MPLLSTISITPLVSGVGQAQTTGAERRAALNRLNFMERRRAGRPSGFAYNLGDERIAVAVDITGTRLEKEKRPGAPAENLCTACE